MSLSASPSNPDGHFEDLEFVGLRGGMLAENHREWYTPESGPMEINNDFKVRASALLAKFPGDEPMGLKNPRSSLFYPFCISSWITRRPSLFTVIMLLVFVLCEIVTRRI